MKTCTKCGETKALDGFHKDRRNRDGHFSTCKACAKAASASYGKTPAGRRATRGRWLRRTYGLSLAEYADLLAGQGHACAICRDPFPEDAPRQPHVDHSHATGQVRGVLCVTCNLGLGGFRDDPTLLTSALNYLATREVVAT